jgi:hypothetical protein
MDAANMKRVWRIFRWLAVTVWFGIWLLGPGFVLVTFGQVDPRDPFPFAFSAVGCLVLAGGWLYISVYYGIFDDFPEDW